MPAIPDFPQSLLHQHHNWHVPGEHADAGPGRVHPAGTPGAGLEFLVFHRDYTTEFRAWYDTTTFATEPFDDPAKKARLVAPWQSVPIELQKPEYGWNAIKDDVQRLDSGSPDFETADELGTYIETGIHNNLLRGAAVEYNEPALSSFHSPRITYFYAVHGLVDHWWAQWQRRHEGRQDGLTLTPRLPKRVRSRTEVPGGVRPVLDPVVLRSLADGLDRLDPRREEHAPRP